MFFFFNDTATTEIYTLSLHDALPISPGLSRRYPAAGPSPAERAEQRPVSALRDRKSTRLNSSHVEISYAVFCLKKKKEQTCTQLKPQRPRSTPVRRKTTATIRTTSVI